MDQRRLEWWHRSSVGHYVNSLHLWSVELFFFFHGHPPVGQVLDGGLARGRAPTCITGVVAFLVSIGTAFTGYLIQTNLDSQWISTQAKDGLNSVGVGAWFNVLDTGQMVLFHVALLPLGVGAITVVPYSGQDYCWNAASDATTGCSELGMTSPSDRSHFSGTLTELSEAVCREHLAQHSAGRIGLLTPAGPQILPVTYQFRNGNVVFRTSPSGVLSGLVRRSSVAFEIDEIDEQTHSGWSVLVLGFAQAMAHNALLTSAWETGPVPWAEGTRNVFIEITPRTISGRLLGAATTVS